MDYPQATVVAPTKILLCLFLLAVLSGLVLKTDGQCVPRGQSQVVPGQAVPMSADLNGVPNQVPQAQFLSSLVVGDGGKAHPVQILCNPIPGSAQRSCYLSPPLPCSSAPAVQEGAKSPKKKKRGKKSAKNKPQAPCGSGGSLNEKVSAKHLFMTTLQPGTTDLARYEWAKNKLQGSLMIPVRAPRVVTKDICFANPVPVEHSLMVFNPQHKSVNISVTLDKNLLSCVAPRREVVECGSQFSMPSNSTVELHLKHTPNFSMPIEEFDVFIVDGSGVRSAYKVAAVLPYEVTSVCMPFAGLEDSAPGMLELQWLLYAIAFALTISLAFYFGDGRLDGKVVWLCMAVVRRFRSRSPKKKSRYKLPKVNLSAQDKEASSSHTPGCLVQEQIMSSCSGADSPSTLPANVAMISPRCSQRRTSPGSKHTAGAISGKRAAQNRMSHLSSMTGASGKSNNGKGSNGRGSKAPAPKMARDDVSKAESRKKSARCKTVQTAIVSPVCTQVESPTFPTEPMEPLEFESVLEPQKSARRDEPGLSDDDLEVAPCEELTSDEKTSLPAPQESLYENPLDMADYPQESSHENPLDVADYPLLNTPIQQIPKKKKKKKPALDRNDLSPRGSASSTDSGYSGEDSRTFFASVECSVAKESVAKEPCRKSPIGSKSIDLDTGIYSSAVSADGKLSPAISLFPMQPSECQDIDSIMQQVSIVQTDPSFELLSPEDCEVQGILCPQETESPCPALSGVSPCMALPEESTHTEQDISLCASESPTAPLVRSKSPIYATMSKGFEMSYQSIPADEDFDGGDFLARLRANSRPKTSTLNKAAPQPSQQFVSRLSPVVVPKSPQLSEVSVDPFEDAPDVSSAPLRLSPPTLPTGWQANSRESEATKRTRRQPPVVNVQYVPCLPFPAAAPAPTAWMAPHYAAFSSPIVSSNATGCAPSLGWSPVYGRNVVQPVAVPTAAAIPARIVQSVPKVAHAGTLGAQKPVDKIQERMDKVLKQQSLPSQKSGDTDPSIKLLPSVSGLSNQLKLSSSDNSSWPESAPLPDFDDAKLSKPWSTDMPVCGELVRSLSPIDDVVEGNKYRSAVTVQDDDDGEDLLRMCFHGI